MPASREPHELGRRTFLKGVAAGAVGLGLSGHLVRRARAEEEAPAAGNVKSRVLGRTGRNVSSISFGGGGLNPQSTALLQAAYDRGIDFIDVAWGYGRGAAERGVGAFLEGFPDREKLFIATKASGFRPPSGSSAAVHQAFKAAVQESLARMKTDYVDLLMWPHGAAATSFLKNKAMRDSLRKLKEEGLVRHFGTSTHTNYARVCEAAIEDGFYDVLLTVLNICTQNPEKAGNPAPGGRRRGRPAEDTRKLLAMAKRKNIGIMAMKVANPGFLGVGTDALLAASYPADSPLSRHQKLYDYGLKQEGVSSVTVGIRSGLHLREAVAVGAA